MDGILMGLMDLNKQKQLKSTFIHHPSSKSKHQASIIKTPNIIQASSIHHQKSAVMPTERKDIAQTESFRATENLEGKINLYAKFNESRLPYQKMKKFFDDAGYPCVIIDSGNKDTPHHLQFIESRNTMTDHHVTYIVELAELMFSDEI